MTTQRITILLCTFNGAAHLDAQLRSYLAQTHQSWDLWVSDDGSTDDTDAILERFRRDHSTGRAIRILKGPQQGGTVNFLSLMCHPDLPPGPIALSDQDDVWMPEKLSRALAAIAQAGDVVLYGAQSLHTDHALRVSGKSVPMPRPPSFGNALVQNIVSGHSAVLSAGALQLVRRAGVPSGVPYHDWWLYQLIIAAGGAVVIDNAAVLYYRQHGANAIGANRGFRACIGRITMVIGRHYGVWLAANIAALTNAENLLSQSSQAVLADLRIHPRRFGIRRVLAFARGDLLRQSWGATVLLYVAVLFGRA